MSEWVAAEQSQEPSIRGTKMGGRLSLSLVLFLSCSR